MTWAWVGTVWMVALLILGVVMAIVLLSVLVILVAYTVDTIREGLRSAREKREDAAAGSGLVSGVQTGAVSPSDARRFMVPSAPNVPAPVQPPRTNVVSIMRHEDQQ